mmetsp:Transcript_10956/g.23495  ORF Transcript_10956/g.23495 Transcript_10956/m.23495 type:complete len:246 (-) Transcript_10956:53-790(-)
MIVWRHIVRSITFRYLSSFFLCIYTSATYKFVSGTIARDGINFNFGYVITKKYCTLDAKIGASICHSNPVISCRCRDNSFFSLFCRQVHYMIRRPPQFKRPTVLRLFILHVHIRPKRLRKPGRNLQTGMVHMVVYQTRCLFNIFGLHHFHEDDFPDRTNLIRLAKSAWINIARRGVNSRVIQHCNPVTTDQQQRNARVIRNNTHSRLKNQPDSRIKISTGDHERSGTIKNTPSISKIRLQASPAQ